VAVCTVVIAGQILIGTHTIVGQSNFRQVVPGKVYRSAQPSLDELRTWAKRYGIRTVINLSGYTPVRVEAQQEERNFVGELGLTYVGLGVRVDAVPSAERLREMIHAIETAEPPLLIHCYRGIDRSGTVSAMAAMALGQQSFEQAKWQAYVAPGPWKRWQEGNYMHISDVLLEYERFCGHNGLDTGGWEQFKSWAAQR